jgi:prepilin-type N-terminal cleavage/methylation domain-containing protein
MHDRGRRGFTLTEVMIAAVVIGVGISSTIFGMGAGINTTHEGRGILVAGSLAEYFMHFSKNLAIVDPQEGAGTFGPESGEEGLEDYDDVDDLNGLVLVPPIGADGVVLTALPTWSQEVTVTAIDPDTFQAVAGPGDGTARRVGVEIRNSSRLVGRYEWIQTKR